MIRYMVSRKLSSFVPDLAISNVDLAYWGISEPVIAPRTDDLVCKLTAEQHVPFNQIQYLSSAKKLSRVEWFGYGQRMENFPPKQICRDLFQVEQDVGTSLPRDCLLCPIRAGEILDAIHPGYTVVPIGFYEEIVEETGLRPVFMGQLAQNAFTDKLRKRFPNALYLPHCSAIDDFQTIRKAHHIVVPVSTFAWLAAWLSNATTIIMPVFGIFNPKLFSLHDLLPLAEPQYRFFAFPEVPAVPLAELEEVHRAMHRRWYEVKSVALAPTLL